MPIVNVNGIELYFEEQGSGEAVLLIPASWWPSDTWKVGVVPVLSRRYRTIIFDCRGTGRSSKPADGYTVKQFASDALGLLNHLGVTRCHAVGFALGSLIVQAMAIQRPDLVATLTMAAAGPGSKRLDGGQRELSPETMREISEMGFEEYIRSHIDNDGMAYNPEFYRQHRDLAAALANALWAGQSTVEISRLHEAARLSHPGRSTEGESAGAGALRRRRRRREARQHAGGDREEISAVDSGRGAGADPQHAAYDLLGRRRRGDRVAGFPGASSDQYEIGRIGLRVFNHKGHIEHKING